MTFDPRPYVEGLRRANEREKRAITRRAERAVEEARLLAGRIMANDEGVERVYLFGSVAAGVPTRLDFDIDLAIEGGDVYRAMEIADESEFAVDVVDLRLLPEHVRKRVLESGRIVAER